MRHVLVGFIMDGKAGGIDTYLLNFLEIVQCADVQMDFLTDHVHEELKERLEMKNCELFPIASLRHPYKQFMQVRKILKRKKYDAVYLNVSTAIDCIAAFAAKSMHIEERIIHSHSSGNDCESVVQRCIFNSIHKICRLFFYMSGTRFLGCSIKAGEWIFPEKVVCSEKFEVIYNAVDRKRFEYNEDMRKIMRNELGIGNKGTLVIGHLGNFCYAKNYPFLIAVFEEIYKRRKDSVLLLAGTGIEIEQVKQDVNTKGLSESVKFLGWRRDAERLYQAMDIFLLPSRFEGLPVAGVEAQCTKIQCIFSDSITKESKIQTNCHFLSLKDDPAKWAEFILSHQEYDRSKTEMLPEAQMYNLENQKEQLRRIICH